MMSLFSLFNSESSTSPEDDNSPSWVMRAWDWVAGGVSDTAGKAKNYAKEKALSALGSVFSAVTGIDKTGDWMQYAAFGLAVLGSGKLMTGMFGLAGANQFGFLSTLVGGLVGASLLFHTLGGNVREWPEKLLEKGGDIVDGVGAYFKDEEEKPIPAKAATPAPLPGG